MMQASKWLQVQVLLDLPEMEALIQTLNPFEIYITSTTTEPGQNPVLHAQFLESYKNYVHSLQAGTEPDEALTRHLFSSIWTTHPADHIQIRSLSPDRQLARLIKPAIQLQNHRLDYSTADGKFYSMVFGTDSISWGIQFAYPQLFQDPATQQIEKTLNNPERFPNGILFSTLQKWIRNHTIPASFLVNDRKINIPARLGKKSVTWINNHPHLIKKKIKFVVPS